MGFKQVKLSHISLKALEVGHVYDYPIFYPDSNEVYKVLINKGSQFTDTVKDIISKQNITDVYIKVEDHKQYELDTQKYLDKISHDKNIPVSLKSEILHEMSADVINELFEGNLNKDKIRQVDSIVEDTVSLILDDQTSIKAMLKVTSHDYYTYTHCVNVSTYALGFGAFLNLNKEQLQILGKAGILHDVGKRRIPNEIINKNGKLTEAEFTTMKNHPTYGVDILKELGATNKILLDTVEHHHEKLDGTGYPNGLKDKDIHPFAQIMAIADIFDALTTKRSYKAAMKSFEAFNIMHNHMKRELNNKLLKKFMVFMSQ